MGGVGVTHFGVLTQHALAELVNTSQQQIQRIETGKIAARLELAAKLAEALKTPLAVLFPGSAKPLRKLAAAYERVTSSQTEEISELAESGIEGHQGLYFRFRLRGHEDALAGGIPFILFDTMHERVAINARELVYCHFLFEHAAFVEEEERDNGSEEVAVFLAGHQRPLSFGVDPDDGHPDDEEDEDGEHVFLRAGDVALLKVPLSAVDPDYELDEE